MKKQHWVDCIISCIITAIICIHSINVVVIYGADILDMCSLGRLLFVVPAIVFGGEFVAFLYVIKAVRTQRKGKVVIVQTVAILALALAPTIVVSVTNSLALDAVEISTQNLSSAQIQRIQDLAITKDAFPYKVSFHWQTGKVRAVFKRGDGRFQMVHDTITGG